MEGIENKGMACLLSLLVENESGIFHLPNQELGLQEIPP